MTEFQREDIFHAYYKAESPQILGYFLIAETRPEDPIIYETEPVPEPEPEPVQEVPEETVEVEEITLEEPPRKIPAIPIAVLVVSIIFVSALIFKERHRIFGK